MSDAFINRDNQFNPFIAYAASHHSVQPREVSWNHLGYYGASLLVCSEFITFCSTCSSFSIHLTLKSIINNNISIESEMIDISLLLFGYSYFNS